MAKLRFLGNQVIHVTVDGKEFAFSQGKIFDLSPENSYIASLKEQGFFEEVVETPTPVEVQSSITKKGK